MRLIAIPLLLGVLLVGACVNPEQRSAAVPAPAATTLSLIPMPANLETGAGHFTLQSGSSILVRSEDPAVMKIAEDFALRLQRTRGLRLDLVRMAKGAAIVFDLAPDGTDTESEAYRLDVAGNGIRLSASTPAGLSRGAATLWQLLSAQTGQTNSIELAAIHIEDAPRFRWRGAMLDSARHFQPPAFVKRFIDELALLKFNTLHWHLTDDQGWRIQIRRYPRLTDVGAWRHAAGAPDTDPAGNPLRYGGFYSQDEIRDIVAYAAARNITIVPEIDMPGHMQAAIAAYPELGSLGNTPVVSPDWGVHAYLLNADESTIHFMQNVLDEVMELFPSPWIHIGGDEAIKDQWQASPRVQARLKELGLKDENALQGWFIARMSQYLEAHGRKLIGWDEILDSEVPADAVVMSWRGNEGGIKAAKAGHDVVMSPSPDLYLNHLQSDLPDEQGGRLEVRSLADTYAFNPLPAALDAKAAAHILGAQANFWTEHMPAPANVENAAFPRLAALAEVLWSPPAKQDWNGFLARMPAQYRRWDADGVRASRTAFEVRAQFALAIKADAYRVTLSDQTQVPIHYTLDGSVPDAHSPLYRSELTVASGTQLHAAAFVGNERIGEVLSLKVDRAALQEKYSADLKQCAGKVILRLADPGAAGKSSGFRTVDIFDPCWIWPAATLDGVRSIAVDATRLPYNFQLAHDVGQIVPRPKPQSANGELIVSRDGCAGATVATIALPDKVGTDGIVHLRAPLAVTGAHDLCLRFSGKGPDPLWAIDRVRLLDD